MSVGAPRSGSRLASWKAAAAVYLERRLVFVLLMGFASGLPLLLTASTLATWLTEAGISLTTIGLFALVASPYSLKFAWAPFIDRVPVPGLDGLLGRRRAWMLLTQLGLLGAIVALAHSAPETTPLRTVICALLVAFFSASQDIVIDAYRIEILDDEQQGAGVAMTQAGYRVGLIAAGAGALFLADAVGWRQSYLVMAALIGIGLVTTLLAPAPPREVATERRALGSWLTATVVSPFVELLARNGARLGVVILAFVILFKLGDVFLGVMAYPFYIKIGFTKTEIAAVSKLFGVGATLIGVFVGGLLVARLGVLRTLLAGGLLQMLSNLVYSVQAGLGDRLSFLFVTIGFENFSGGLASSAFIAYLSLLCHRAYTGTQFALLTSLMALGRTWLSASSGWVADRTDWASFFVISALVAIPGLLLLLWMMKHLPLAQQRGGLATNAAASPP